MHASNLVVWLAKHVRNLVMLQPSVCGEVNLLEQNSKHTSLLNEVDPEKHHGFATQEFRVHF